MGWTAPTPSPQFHPRCATQELCNGAGSSLALRNEPAAREDDGNRGADTDLTIDVERGAVGLGQVLGEREAKARAGPASSELAVDPAEVRERLRQISIGDADTRVANNDAQALAGRIRLEHDPSPCGRELDRVGQQVEQD